MIHRPTLSVAFLLLCAPSFAAVYKCADDGAVVYTDQPCADARTPALTPAPLPTMPALKAAPAASGGQRKAASTGRQEPRHLNAKTGADTAQKKKCDKLALRRRWAEEDVRETGARALKPQDKTMENARRKARRADEQYRLECAAPS